LGRILKLKEAAAMLNCHYKTLEALARNGEVPAFKIGTKRGSPWRFEENSLADWVMKQLKSGAPRARYQEGAE
jgi:excisionase family DNA binding protein